MSVRLVRDPGFLFFFIFPCLFLFSGQFINPEELGRSGRITRPLSSLSWVVNPQNLRISLFFTPRGIWICNRHVMDEKDIRSSKHYSSQPLAVDEREEAADLLQACGLKSEPASEEEEEEEEEEDDDDASDSGHSM